MTKNCGNLTMATRKVVSVPLFCGSYKNNQWKGYNIPTVCILSARDSSCCIDRLVLLDHSHNVSSCYKIGVVLIARCRMLLSNYQVRLEFLSFSYFSYKKYWRLFNADFRSRMKIKIASSMSVYNYQLPPSADKSGLQFDKTNTNIT